MKARKQRYQRLRFRDLDARALDGLRSMMANLPPPSAQTGAVEPGVQPRGEATDEAPRDRVASTSRTSASGSVTEVLAELSRLLAVLPPFASPLEHFEVRLTDAGELTLDQVRLAMATGETAPPAWAASPVAILRRSAQDRYILVRLS